MQPDTSPETQGAPLPAAIPATPEPSPGARWNALAAATPATPDAYLEVLARLVADGDFAVAEAGFAAIIDRYPDNIAVNARFARAAERRGDWPEAVRRWRRARARHHQNKVVVQALAAALVRTGHAERADQLLAEALRRSEGEAGRASDPIIRRMLIDRARLATSRRDFDSAARWWAELASEWPNDEVVRSGALETQTLMRLQSVDAGHEGPMPAPLADEAAPHAALMQRFEGLGGTCEFGLVQRHFGAEPLGLFRWVTLASDHLREAIATSLAGIGDAEFTRMRVSPANEFSSVDTRYGLAMHTFIRNAGQDRQALLTQLQRRMRFLRGKLLEDMQAGEKIFVYRCPHPARDDDLGAISEELRAHNPSNMLLAIRMLPHGAPCEPPRWCTSHIIESAIADGRVDGERAGWAVDYAAWLTACQTCLALIAERNEAAV